jgi:sensor histidine kinase YesM
MTCIFTWRDVRHILTLNFAAGLVGPFLQVYFSGGWGPHLFRSFVLNQIYANCIGTMAALSIMLAYPRLARMAAILRCGILATMMTIVAAIGCLAAGLIAVSLGLTPAIEFWPSFSRSFRFSLLLTFLLGFGSVIYEILRSRIERTTLALRTQELERERALKLATEAQLASLQSRIHPHFLFNALNSISALIRDDPARAERLIERMAALLRFSLDADQLRTIPLRDELRITADYLDIEKTRFGERLAYTIDVSAELLDVAVPPLSIQTLVENSIKHSIAPRRTGGTIRVSAHESNGTVAIETSDDGPGFTWTEAPAGHGLDNLKSRLQAIFNARASLDVQRSSPGVVVTLRVPRRESASEAQLE